MSREAIAAIFIVFCLNWLVWIISRKPNNEIELSNIATIEASRALLESQLEECFEKLATLTLTKARLEHRLDNAIKSNNVKDSEIWELNRRNRILTVKRQEIEKLMPVIKPS